MKLHKIAVLAVAALMSVGAWAEECDINITAVPVFQGDEVPEDVSDMIVTRLTNAAATSGVVGSDNSRFFITAKFNNNFKDVLAGPPPQPAEPTLVTLAKSASGYEDEQLRRSALLFDTNSRM